jgi:NADH-quinone oxidoreductase subunit M
MGIPGFSGFAAEITILLGAWKSYPVAVLITGVGMVLVAAFTVRALKKTFFGEVAVGGLAAPSGDTNHPLAAITAAEKLGAGLLMFATLAVGLYPKFLLDRIMPAVEAMRFLK